MMKKIISLLIIILVLSNCVKDNSLPNQTINVNPQTIELANQNNEFGFDILKKLQQSNPESNIFISPMSISTALAMTLNGTNGESQTQMQNVMRLNGWDINSINSSFLNLLTILPQLDDDVVINIANSIWYQLGFDVYQDFLDINTNSFNSEVNEINFGDPQTLEIINGWCEEKTNGLIKDMLDDIPPGAVMYLINAIYFKGAWTQEFDSEDTYETNFYLFSGESTLIDMMRYDGLIGLPYFNTQNFQAVDLKYGNGNLSMSIILPNINSSIENVLSEINTDNWETWVDSFQIDTISFEIPKFKLEYEKKLKETLIDLGITNIFTDAADFSNMTPNSVNVNEVYHKSFIEVNEVGTEAAAVTVVETEVTSATPYPQFHANRPFLFFIHDNVTNSILFSGIMMNPNE